MNKGLEALGSLSLDILIDNEQQSQRVIKNKEIIKKELEDGEKDHKLKIDICEYFGLDDLFPYDNNSKIMERLEEIQGHYYDIQFKKSKKEKALEIIKIHGVDVYCLKHTNKLIEYNTRNAYVDSITLLTQEEYDLLKEVLL